MSFELLAGTTFRITMIEIPHRYWYTDSDLFFLFLFLVLVLVVFIIFSSTSILFIFFGKFTAFPFIFFVTRTTR